MTYTPLPHQAPRSLAVSRLAKDQGFDMLGIAPAMVSDYQDFLKDWLAAGKHGEMDYLAQHLPKRLDPEKLVPGAKSIICVADRYPTRPLDNVTDDQTQNNSAAKGKVARYAWRRDYHKDMKKRLHLLTDALKAQFPGNTFRATVDTAPVLEREHAQRAGIGWVGKHTLLIHPQKGSFFLLGEIITTLTLQTAVDAGAKLMTNHCGGCTRCIDACPTQCISPYSVDATRCISYLTLEHRSAIDEDMQDKMGDWIAGCDVCQEVCPFNQDPQPMAPKMVMPEPVLVVDADEAQGQGQPVPMPVFTPRSSFDLLEVMNWTAQARQDALIGSALKRIKLEQFKRNAIIAAGNVMRREPEHPQAQTLLQKIQTFATDPAEHELVRRTAAAVIDRLENNKS